MVDFTYGSIDLKDMAERIRFLGSYAAALKRKTFLVTVKIKDHEDGFVKMAIPPNKMPHVEDEQFQSYMRLCRAFNFLSSKAPGEKMEELLTKVENLLEPQLISYFRKLEATPDGIELLQDECKKLAQTAKFQSLKDPLTLGLRVRNFEEPALLERLVEALKEAGPPAEFPHLWELISNLPNDYILENWHDPYRLPLGIPLNESSDKFKLLSWAVQQDILFYCV